MYTSKVTNFLVFILLTVVPLLAGVIYALLYSLGLTGVLSAGFTLENWIKVLTASEFWRSLGFSFYVASVSMILATSLALAAVVRFGSWFQRGVLSFMIYLPLVFPAMVMAFYTFQFLSKGELVFK